MSVGLRRMCRLTARATLPLWIAFLGGTYCTASRNGTVAECPTNNFPLKPLWTPQGPFESARQRALVGTLERLLATVTQVLGEAGVCHWVDQGTLLALWRHAVPVMRHDSDVDVGILLTDLDIAAAALSAASSLRLNDWRSGRDQASPHLEAQLAEAPHARCDIYTFHVDAAVVVPAAGLLESSPIDALFPLRSGPNGLMTPADAEAWLLATEPAIYRPMDIRAADKIFRWTSGVYTQRVTEDGKDSQSFPMITLLLWLPAASAVSSAEAAKNIQEQDYPADSIDLVVMTPDSQVFKELQQWFPSARSAAPCLSDRHFSPLTWWHPSNVAETALFRGNLLCLWDGRARYSWSRLTAQSLPILGGGATATRLRGLPTTSICRRWRAMTPDRSVAEDRAGRGVEVDVSIAAKWESAQEEVVLDDEWATQLPWPPRYAPPDHWERLSERKRRGCPEDFPC